MTAWWLLAAVMLAPCGWTWGLAGRSAIQGRGLLALCLIPALSTGMITLLTFWLGMIGARLTLLNITLPYLLMMLPGWWSFRADRPALPQRPGPFTAFGLLLLASIAAAVMFNALQWPHYRPDTLGIYAPFASELYQTRALVPIFPPDRVLYELYPQLISMNFAYSYFAAGWENPYLAKIASTWLSLSLLPATFLLARHLKNAQAGWIAVFLVALTPDFGNWASAGYVDLPMAYFLVMAVAFLWALDWANRPVDAVLAGLMMGLAAWTKNAALVGVLIFLAWIMMRLIQKRIYLNNAMLACCALSTIAAPWYLRNVWLAGRINPDTVWFDNAQQTWRELFILLTRPQNYGLPGILLTLAGVWLVWRAARGERPAIYLLSWIVPYYVTWLLFASYDPRFILLYLPLLSIAAGLMLSNTIRLKKRAILVLCACLTILSLQAMWNSVDYKRNWLEQPLMDHATKLETVRKR